MQTMGEALKELATKYDAAEVTGFEEVPGGYRVSCNKGDFRFMYDAEQMKDGDIPLYSWRDRRKFKEMANVLKADTVKKPLAIRVKNIRQPSAQGGGMEAVLLREMDICEQLLSGDRIVRIFAVPSKDHPYMNAICSTEKGVKISMELGISPAAEGPVEMHEIVCRTGIITDVAVDTQTEQYPIYVYGQQGAKRYVDIDYELYGMDEVQRDSVRFMLRVLGAADTMDGLRADAARQQSLARKALKGGLCQ